MLSARVDGGPAAVGSEASVGALAFATELALEALGSGQGETTDDQLTRRRDRCPKLVDDSLVFALGNVGDNNGEAADSFLAQQKLGQLGVDNCCGASGYRSLAGDWVSVDGGDDGAKFSGQLGQNTGAAACIEDRCSSRAVEQSGNQPRLSQTSTWMVAIAKANGTLNRRLGRLGSEPLVNSVLSALHSSRPLVFGPVVNQPVNRNAANHVGLDNLVDILFLDPGVPNSLGVNDDVRTFETWAETANR